jgi:uncharacterized protein
MVTRDYSEFPVQAFRRTPEGYLQAHVRATCSGVFPYLADGGLVVNRLRPDSEVGDSESVRSLNSKPVTLRHPDEDVTPDNAKRLQVGFTGTDAEWDGSYVSVTVTVTDRDAIAAIERGEVAALSCGYSADISADPGNWRGSAYDEVMSGIRYNHLALVKAGRAGDGVRFRVGDCALGENFFNDNNPGGRPEGDNMKTMLIDGVQCQADEAVVSRVQGLEKELKDAKDEIAKAKPELDRVTAERDAALAENKKLKDAQVSDAEIARLADEKIALVEKARSLGCDCKAQDSAESIRRAVIAKAFDGMELDGKSADYVSAMYDAAVVALEKAKDAKPEAKESPLAPDWSRVGDGADADPEAAYRKMCEGINGNKKKEG